MSFKYLSIPLAAGLCSLAFAAAQVQAGSVTDALARCGTSSKSATVHCCETVLRKNKKPYWMGDKTCAQVVSCSGGCSHESQGQGQETPVRGLLSQGHHARQRVEAHEADRPDVGTSRHAKRREARGPLSLIAAHRPCHA